jgi:hypothetical protein
MFMNTPPINPAENATQPWEESAEAVPAEPTRSKVLFNVLTLIIQAGAAFLANIAGKKEPNEVQSIADVFGAFNLSVIVARVFRGLRLANALKRRVVVTQARIDTPSPVRATASRTAASRTLRRRRLTEAQDNAALLADICADLGIVPGHRLWVEVNTLITLHSAQLGPLFICHCRRSEVAHREVVTGLAPDRRLYRTLLPPPDTTGPPPQTVAT